ncbi:hypothetical protein D3C80_895600 [compost metagenome]
MRALFLLHYTHENMKRGGSDVDRGSLHRSGVMAGDYYPGCAKLMFWISFRATSFDRKAAIR